MYTIKTLTPLKTPNSNSFKQLIEILANLSWLPRNKHSLVVVDLLFEAAQANISSTWPHIRGSDDDFPDNEEDDEKANHGIVQHEPLDGPATGNEDIIAASEEHECGAGHGDVGRVWLEATLVGQRVPRDIVAHQRGVEVAVDDGSTEVVDQLAAGDEVDEVVEDICRGAADL